MTNEVAGKVAVITGGASGIGLSTAQLFVDEGARVVLADIDDKGGADAVESPGGESVAVYVHTDVTSEDAIENAIATAVEKFGKLDIMVNNAGAGGDPSPIADLSAEGFAKTTALLVNSVFFGHKHAIRQFRAQGAPGVIVTTDSAAGLQPGWGGPTYTISKHAVIGIVKEAAAEVAAEGIRVNAIAPGITRTPIMPRSFGVPLEDGDEFLDFLDDRAGKTQPLGRMGRAEEMAQAILWLASDRSTYITGHVLPVTGGATDIYAGSFMSAAGAAAQEYLAEKK